MKPVYFGVAAVGLGICIQDGAMAGPNHNCDNYADFAMSDIKKAKSNKCGFKGARWKKKRSAHKSWCLQPSTTMAMLSGEDKARKKQVSECIAANASKPSDSNCKDYAQKAINQAASNMVKKCGGTGPRWSLTFMMHYNWCMNGATKVQLWAEHEKRSAALSNCGKP